MNIALLGANTNVGKLILDDLIERDYKVKILSSKIKTFAAYKKSVKIIKGDIFKIDALLKLVSKVDVVICAACPPKTGNYQSEIYAVFMDLLINAMKENRVKRLISISEAAAKFPNESLSLKRSFYRSFYKITRSNQLNTRELILQKISNSNLNWTALRPLKVTEWITDKPVNADLNQLFADSICEHQLSTFLVENIDNETWIKKAPLLS